MKITIITTTYNSELTILDTLTSINQQTYHDIEHIIVDGASTDNTLALIKQYGQRVSRVISEKDKGTYDALNKGISLATGDIIGLLHADDCFAYDKALADIAHTFKTHDPYAIYGDLAYIPRFGKRRLVRTWLSGEHTDKKFYQGWMPPHPTFYMKRSCYKSLGGYDISLKIAADYDAMVRYMLIKKIKVVYIPKILVYMKMGGISTRLSDKYASFKEEMIVIQRYQLGGFITFIKKKLYKLPQFF